MSSRWSPLALTGALSITMVANAEPPVAPPAAAPAKQGPTDDEIIRTAAPVLKKIPKVAWLRGQVVAGDVIIHHHKDVVALGIEMAGTVMAVVPGPVTAASQPIVLHFPNPKLPDAKPTPKTLCGSPGELRLNLEPPGVKPSDISCALGDEIDARCRHVLEVELTLQKSQHTGGKGIVISGGACLPLHLYFADGKFQAWRND